MTNLSGSLSYRKDSNSFFINETGTNDGWVPLPISVNAKDLSNSDLRSLAERLGGGSKYQIYVDVDNPSSSDAKLNSGVSPLTPFKTLERALLEVARRSFRTLEQEERLGETGDSFERYTINLAPGEYTIQNTPGGFASISNYPDYQIASNLIQRNRDWIVAESIDATNGVTGPTRTALVQDLLSWVVSIATDLSSLTNRSSLISARAFLNPNKNIVCTNPLAPPNNFFVGIYTSLNVRQQAVVALTELKLKSVAAAQNAGFITDPNITINPLAPEQITIYDKIIELADLLIRTLQCIEDPRFESITNFGFPSSFPETGEPSKEFYTMFNDPSRSGVILPRGVSIIGVDLRKVNIRPAYVPDYEDGLAERGAIFKMTGANFFSGFTIKDKRGLNKSHHMLTGFEFSTQVELDSYYDKVRLAFSDKTIYHRAQDAANLLEKNLEWVSNKSVPAIVQANEINYATVLEGEIFYIVKAIISDLRLLDKQNVYNLGKRFHLTHILPIADSGDRLEAQIFYKSSLDDAKLFIRDAINNEANTSEGGVIDESIIVDTTPGARCADVVSAIYSYISILKNHIEGMYSGNLTADGFTTADVDPFAYETSIVIDHPNNGTPVTRDVDSVIGASPYIFSASLRSEYGMNGIHGDGSKVRGLKSYLAAQFTVISMQKDDAAFYRDDTEVGGFRYKGNKKTDSEDFRHFGYKVSNGAYSQLVSCFCICPAVHYWADGGSEFSITNSTSNFGDISLYSEGYLPISYPQDRGLKVVGIIKPKFVDYLANPADNYNKATNFVLGVIESFDIVVPGANPRRPNEAKITLNTEARFLTEFPSILDPDALNYIYIASSLDDLNPYGTRERYAKIKSVTKSNTLGKTEVVIEQIYGSWPTVPQNIQLGQDGIPGYDSVVLGRQLYIKRFIDNRSPSDRQYSLVTAHELDSFGSLNSKRKPVVHYVLTANATPQPFNTNDIRESFYIVGAPGLPAGTGGLTQEFRDSHDIYALKIAATKANALGQIEFEQDLDLNSRLELDVDPLDPDLGNVINKNTFSKQNITKFLNLLGIPLPNLNIQSGTQFINLLSRNVSVQSNKPSIIRCGGQTWEYLGYYNYFTGLPFAQTEKLGDKLSDQRQKLLRIEKTQTFLLGGRVYATGMDEEGNSYVGNTFQDLKTGQTEQIIRGSSTEVLSELDNNTLPSSVRFLSITIGPDSRTLTRGSLILEQESDVDISSDNFRFNSESRVTFEPGSTITGLPGATEDEPGVARKANRDEIVNEQTDTLEEYPSFVTPEDLREWRVANKIVSQVSGRYTVYVSNHPSGKHTLTATGLAPSAGTQVSYEEFESHNERVEISEQWQLDNNTINSFRCLKSMKDVESYINAKLTTSDTLRLFIDPGKYQADYTYNCALVISGANNLGGEMWGNPDGTSTPSNGSGVILYPSCSVSVLVSTSPDSYRIKSNSIDFNNTTRTNSINYVHFWSWAEAIKDPTIEFSPDPTLGISIKRVNDNSLEDVLQRVNNHLNSTSAANFPIPNYNYFYGFNSLDGSSDSFIRLLGSGPKTFRFCSFSGGGIGDQSLFSVEDSCTVSYSGLVFRGNIDTRLDLKHISKRDSNNTHLNAINNSTKRLISGNIFDTTALSRYSILDPYDYSLVYCGFYSHIFSINQAVNLNLEVGSQSFSTEAFTWGTTTLSGVSTSGSFGSNPTMTTNSDLKNALRLEKYTKKLFGTTDDRIYDGTTTENIPEVSLAYRGTDNLGEYLYNVSDPSVLNQSAFETLLENYKNQGPIIYSFYKISPDAKISFSRPFISLHPNRDTSDLVRSQGILGSFGRDCFRRINTVNYSELKRDFQPETFANSFNNDSNVIGFRFFVPLEYHKNSFYPAWRGFSYGRYSYPVIVDCVRNQPASPLTYSQFMTALGDNNYARCKPYIEATLGYSMNLVPPYTQFILVWGNINEVLSVVYLGRSADLTTHYFVPLGTTTNVGLSQYFSAKTAGNIYETFEAAKSSNTLDNVQTDEVIYIRSSNLLLSRRSTTLLDDPNLISSWLPIKVDNAGIWQSYAKPGNDIVFNNLSLLGLFCTRVSNTFSAEKLGAQVSTYDTSGITSIPATVSELYTACAYPTSTFPSGNNTNALKAYLSTGYNFFNKFSGASLSVEGYDTSPESISFHNNLTT